MIFISLVVESMMTISGFGPSAAKMRFLMRADDPVLPSRTVNPSTMRPSCVQRSRRVFFSSSGIYACDNTSSMAFRNLWTSCMFVQSIDEAYPIVKTKKSDNEDRLLYGRTEIDRRWCLISSCLMLPPRIVAHKERPSPLHRLSWRLIIFQRDLLIFDGPPQPFNKDI